MKKTIRDIDLTSKRIIIRCDFNVPLDDNLEIIDDTRIIKALPTIKYAISKNAKVILMSHLGRIKSVEDKNKYSLKPVYERLCKYLDNKIYFSKDTNSPELTEMVNNLKDGEILLMENTRFEDLVFNKESNNKSDLAKYWSSLGDIFVNDAFGTIHRNHASNIGISNYLPSVIGLLVEKEISNLSKINMGKKPLLVIMGGAKISDKLDLIDSLAKKADYILLGGGIANTFLVALKYNMGSSLVEKEQIENALKLYNKYKNKIVLPIDLRVFKKIKDLEYENKLIKDLEDNDIALDLGDLTIKEYSNYIVKSATIFWNGPLGMVENKQARISSSALLKEICNNKNIFSVLGGGDIVGFAKTEGMEDVSFISTGGGATLKFLSDKELMAYNIIDEKK